MKIKILEKSERKVSFVVEGVKPSFIGSLRRVMISEIPTMAIEWVNLRKNDSAMPDELFANRLGQVPLTYDEKVYNLPEDCKCDGEGCTSCQVELSLKKKGPGYVYSDDLKTTDDSVQPAIEKIPIVELFDDQEIELTATAQLGTGKEHAKWQGAVVGYKNLPKISINDIAKKDLEKFKKICPKDVFEIKDDKLVITDPVKCNLCNKCVEISENGEIEVSPIEDSFVLNVESASGIAAEDTIKISIEILRDKTKDFKKAVDKL